MSMPTEKRRLEISTYADEHGDDEAVKFFGVAHDTIRRYRDLGKATQKVLIFDIETAPMLGYFWDIWQQNIGTAQILEDWSILSWAAKWLESDEILSDAVWFHSKSPRKDKRVCRSLAKLLSEANIVVAHNGDKFDIKRINTRLLYHGIQEPSPYRSVDTLKIVKSRFAITSNKLDYVAQFLDIGRKVKHDGQELWNKVLENDKEAQDKMMEYNIGDITLLEQVYLKVRSWNKRQPNVNVTFGKRRCPCCGSDKLKTIDTVYTNVSSFKALMCKECGKYSRTGQRMKDKNQMAMTQRNIL